MKTWRLELICLLFVISLSACWAGYDDDATITLYANNQTSLVIDTGTRNVSVTWHAVISGTGSKAGILDIKRATSPNGTFTKVGTITTNSSGVGNTYSTELIGYIPDAGGYYYFKAVGAIAGDGGTIESDPLVIIDVNRAPIAANDSYTAHKNNSLNISSAQGVLANDSDPDFDAITAIKTAEPSPGTGTVTLQSSGAFTYTPPAGFTGQATFKYRAKDEHNLQSVNEATVTINVINDPPIANSGQVTTNEDTSTTFTISAFDQNDDQMTWHVGTPSHGILTGTAPSLTYSPAADYFGLDSFTFHVHDSVGATSDDAVVSISVRPVNDAPSFTAGPTTITVLEDQFSTTPYNYEHWATNIKKGGLPPYEESGQTLTFVLTKTSGPNDMFDAGPSIDPATGNLTFKTKPNMNGQVSYDVVLHDDGGIAYGGDDTSETAKLTIIIQSVGDPPVAYSQTVTTPEDTPLSITLTAYDVDGDPIIWQPPTSPSHGSLTGTAPNLTYTPVANYNGPDSFTFYVTAGGETSNTATISITVSPVNDPPVITENTPEPVVLSEDCGQTSLAPTILTLTATDVDGDTLSWSVVSTRTERDGEAHAGGQGAHPTTLTYTPAANFFGVDHFTVKVTDGNGGWDTAVVTVSVNPVQDPPVAYSQSVETDEDTPKPIHLVALDPDADQLIWHVSSPANGTLSGTAPNMTYTPDLNYFGLDSFTFYVNDSIDDSNIATVSITVKSVNDPPVAYDQTVEMNEDDAAKSITLTAFDTEGDPLSWRIDNEPAHGTRTGTPPNVAYAPNPNYHGPDSFTFIVNDGELDSSPATVSITINPIQDPPIAIDDTYTVERNSVDNPLDVLANDSDADNDPLTIIQVTDPPHGTAVVDGSQVKYTPDTDYFGSDSFAYTISDGHGNTDSAVVGITVVGVDLVVGGVSEADEETIGASVRVNDDFDEHNDFSNGMQKPDNQPIWIDFGMGYVSVDRIIQGDTDLSSASVTVQGKVGMSGKLTIALNQPAKLFVWGSGTPLSWPYEVQVSPMTGGTYTETFLVEGIDHSTSARDIVLTAEFTPTNSNFTADDLAKITIFGLGIDVDTFNNSGFSTAVHNYPGFEDWVEDRLDMEGHPNIGKYVAVNDDDDDRDGITDSSDGYNADGQAGNADDEMRTPGGTPVTQQQFAPLILEMQGPYAPERCRVRFTYNTQKIRLWTAEKATPREGKLVASGQIYSEADLGVQGDTAVLWVEALALCQTEEDRRIVAEVDLDGGAFTTFTDDALRVIPSQSGAVDDAYTIEEDSGTHTFNVLANDTFGYNQSIASVSRAQHGTTAINGTSVTYTPAPNFVGTDTFSYNGIDSIGGNDWANVVVTVTGDNEAPVAKNMTVEPYEDNPVTFKLVAIDADNDPLTYTVTSNPTAGTLTGTAPNLTYSPAPNYFGLDSFTFKANDGQLDSNVATVHLSVNPLNDPPRAFDDSVVVAEDHAAVQVPVLANDDCLPDVGETLSVIDVSGASYGTAELIDGAVYYTPAPDFFGSDWFEYTISDGNDGTSTALVSVNVTNGNDPPLAVDDYASVDEDSVTDIDVLANDSDPDGDALTISGIGTPQHGTAQQVTVEEVEYIRYTPTANYFGDDWFTYTISDGNDGTSTATIWISVANIPETVDAVDDYVSTDEDTTGLFAVLDNDWPEPVSDLTITMCTSPGHGTATIVYGTEDAISYTPDANYFGTDAFQYTIQDTQGATDTATVYITITSVNDPPTTEEFKVHTYQNLAIEDIDMLAHASCAPDEGETLSLDSVTTPSEQDGLVTQDGNTVTYAPAFDYIGIDSFNYTISDGNGGTATSTVWVFVEESGNTPPIAVTDAYTVEEDSGETQLNLLANDDDPDDDPLSIVYFPTKPQHGTVRTDGYYAYYTPDPDYFGNDSFVYLITDNNGGTDTTIVNISVTGVPDSVDAIDDSITVVEDSTENVIPVMDNDKNPDNLPLTVAVTSGPYHGTATVDGTEVKYSPAAAYFGTDYFIYELQHNGSPLDAATVYITVEGLNDPPDAVDDYRDNLQEDVDNQTILVLSNDSDPDGDPISIVDHTDGCYGSVTVVKPGGGQDDYVTYTPAADYFGPDYFTYTIADPDGAQSTATVYLTVVNADDGPRAEDDLDYAPMNGSGHHIDVLANDSDPEGDPLTITLPAEGAEGYPEHGDISLEMGDPDTVKYVPDPNYFGYDSFTYQVDDGHGGTASAGVSVVVYKLTVNVAPGVWVPGYSPEAVWAVAVNPVTVILTVESTPSGVPFDEMSITWTGAAQDAADQTKASVDGSTVHVYDTHVTVTDEDNESISENTTVVVVGIDRIVSDSPELHEVEEGNSDNAVTAVSADPSTVTVKALVLPSTPDVSAVYNQLLVWDCSEGQQGTPGDRWIIDRTEPAKTATKVTCGSSSDTLDVWAVSVNLTIGKNGEDEEELDEKAVPVRWNMDDDDLNGEVDLGQSNALGGTGIMGENDLVMMNLEVLPRDLPDGTLTLTLPEGDDFAVCAATDKKNGRISTLSWPVSQAQPAKILYLEGLQLCDPKSFTLDYEWNEVQVEDLAKAKVEQVSESEASLHLYQADKGWNATKEKGGGEPIGGNTLVVLEVKLGPGARVAAEDANIWVADSYDPETLAAYWGVDFTTSENWYVVQPGLMPQDWQAATQAPNQANTGGTIILGYIGDWATPWEPYLYPYTPHMGHNGGHAVWVDDIDGQSGVTEIPFQVGAGAPEAVGPTPLSPDVRNLVISNVRTSNGTVDYFKYDPDPESKYNRPEISYTVEDEGDQHQYDFYFIVRPTKAYLWTKPNKNYPEAYGWDCYAYQPPSSLGQVSFTWDGSSYPGGKADTAEWGTYTFEVFALEYESAQDHFEDAIDWFYYKYPYCLHIGDENDADHNVWYYFTDENELQLRCNYVVSDYAFQNQEPLFVQPERIILTVVDAELKEHQSEEQGGSEIGVWYNGDDQRGILSHTFSDEEFINNWRVIFQGEDKCWKTYRRDHNNTRMLAVNQVAKMFTLTSSESVVINKDVIIVKATAITSSKEPGSNQPVSKPAAGIQMRFFVYWPNDFAEKYTSCSMAFFAQKYTNNEGIAEVHYLAFPPDNFLPHDMDISINEFNAKLGNGSIDDTKKLKVHVRDM